MRKWIPLAALLLLTACATPQAEVSQSPVLPSAPPPSASKPVRTPEPAPSPGAEVPEEALSLLDLAEGETVLECASGDLDGDGREDLAVVVDRNEEDPTGERRGRVRELCVLYGEDGGYRLGERSTTLLLRSEEGGIFGDPYDGVFIDNGLKIHFYGGSSYRWSISLLFSWQDGGLILTQAEETGSNVASYSVNGTEEQWDFIQNEYTEWTFGETEEQSAFHKLLYQTELTVSEPWTLEEMESVWQIEEAVDLPPLPSLGNYGYGRDYTGMLQHSPEEMLDKVKETYYPDMVRVDIPWAEGTQENYSAAMGGPAPGYYYTDGVQMLSYFCLEEQPGNDGLSLFRHTIMWEDSEDWAFYRLWDETGEEV